MTQFRSPFGEQEYTFSISGNEYTNSGQFRVVTHGGDVRKRWTHYRYGHFAEIDSVDGIAAQNEIRKYNKDERTSHCRIPSSLFWRSANVSKVYTNLRKYIRIHIYMKYAGAKSDEKRECNVIKCVPKKQRHTVLSK